MKRNTLARLALALCAAAALMLTGCGGGDGVSPSTHMDVEDERDTYKAEAERLQALLGSMDDAASATGSLHAQLNQAKAGAAAANMEVTRLEGVLGMMDDEAAADGSVYAQLNQAKAGAAAANMEVTRLEGVLGMMDDEADADGSVYAQLKAANAEAARLQGLFNTATARVKELEDASQDREDMEAREAASKAAEALRKAIMEKDPMLDAAPQASAPSMAASSTGVITAKLTGYKMEAGSPDAISGWRGATLTKLKNTIVAYSDIANAMAKPLGDVYDASAGTAGQPTSYNVAGTGTGNTIPWTAVARDDSATLTTPDNTATTDVDEFLVTFTGMVSNVRGTFSCTTDGACTPPVRTKDGNVDETATDVNANNWSFAPTNSSAMVDVQDEDGHLVFGWWLLKDSDGLPMDVDVFTAAIDEDGMAMTARDAGSTSGTILVGTSTYRGGAAGKYALHTLGAGQSSEAGHFTAGVTLTADFDVDLNTADNIEDDGIMVSGEISNFMTGTTTRDWTVKLTVDGNGATGGTPPLANLASDTFNAATVTAEWDIGGNAKGTGTWEAMFYGMDADAAAEDQHPLAVTGEFEAGLGTVGHIIGAFGANSE